MIITATRTTIPIRDKTTPKANGATTTSTIRTNAIKINAPNININI